MIRTRLDTVVRLRERDEDAAAREVANAERGLRNAQQQLDDAKARALSDFRARNDVAQWELQELAQHRALDESKKAARAVETAKALALKSRERFTTAHQRAEVVRRAADTRREELTRELDRAETKQLDDVAALLFNRQS
jgi:flagellar biosynthesis chaperone FliJ